MPKIPRKELKAADEMVRTAEKIYNYRCDLLPAEDRAALRSAADALSDLKDDRENEDAEKLKVCMEALEKQMVKSGGGYYPKRVANENIEVLLVAAILAICIRMFFLQPFRIPTNSMYPTYNGMTYELFVNPADAPSFLMRPVRAVLFGASHEGMKSDSDGEIVVPVFPSQYAKEGFYVYGSKVNGRKWFGLLPSLNAEYTLLVGGQPQKVQVPLDFSFSKVVWSRFGSPTRDRLEYGNGGVLLYHTGVFIKKGDPVLSFDILLGDQLFVDRVSYHFRRPHVGEPIVFRTDNIPGMSEGERGKYYIKRLVGTAGDVLQVKAPVLQRNGAPITGAAAFDMNANKTGEYEGYLPSVPTPPGYPSLIDLSEPYTVPAGTCIGMGDNSDESADSRVWGPMPESALVGRALVIYYPFTKHLGAAK